MTTKFLKTILATAILSCAVSAHATPITFAGSNSTLGLAASVAFDISGTNLQVTLTNTATSDPRAPGDILTGVIFSLPGNTLLGKGSATLPLTSSVIHGPATSMDPGRSVGGEWGYTNVLTGAFVGQQAIYSSGYFDGQSRFDGNNLQGPDSVDGVQYGITTTFDMAANDNGGLKGSGLIKNSVFFVLTGLDPDFLLNSITGVSFQYGTALNEPNFTGECTSGCTPPPPPPPPPPRDIPEPTSLALLGLAILGLGGSQRSKRKGTTS